MAQSWPIARFKAIGKAFDGTLNDAVLAVCAGALRRQLQEQHALPSHSLKAMAPISLRADGDLDSANAIGFITADLGTNQRDPAKRMQVIQQSMRAGKEQLKGMSAREVQVYNIITQAPMLILTLAGLASKFPAFSTVVSNVPGPRQAMYWNGARLDGLYPVSIPFDGFAVNITMLSNNENLDFGIVASRHSVPKIQHLIDHMEAALNELEIAGGISAESEKKPGDSRRKIPLKKKAGTRKPASKSAAAPRPGKKKVGKKTAKKKTAKKPTTADKSGKTSKQKKPSSR